MAIVKDEDLTGGRRIAQRGVLDLRQVMGILRMTIRSYLFSEASPTRI